MVNFIMVFMDMVRETDFSIVKLHVYKIFTSAENVQI